MSAALDGIRTARAIARALGHADVAARARG